MSDAPPSDPTGRGLDPADVPAIKGMLARGDVQSDIAAYFGVNAGRIAAASC
jgi:hypothetical protein